MVFGLDGGLRLKLNPSWIHIPDGLIRSLCRHIDPLIWISSPEKLNRWCMRSHFDFFSVRARDWIFLSIFFLFFVFATLLWTTPEKIIRRQTFREQKKNRVPRVRSKKVWKDSRATKNKTFKIWKKIENNLKIEPRKRILWRHYYNNIEEKIIEKL